MSDSGSGQESESYWFVGASYGGTNDQTDRFVEQGIWENGYQDKYLESVKAIRPGDRIAIKSSFTRKHNLPFDNRGHSVSVMAIKAIGTVVENLRDGRNLRVEWQRVDPPREWYFYTSRFTVWHVQTGKRAAEALIDFTFNDVPQDIDRFRNWPYWRERFGDRAQEDRRFEWTRFYEAIADGLLAFKDDRTPLIDSLHRHAETVEHLSHLQDRYADGTSGPLTDICPFTAFGVFNRGLTEDNRRIVARCLAEIVGVDLPVPASFEGIPVLNNQNSWFFAYSRQRQAGDIDSLWRIFDVAIQYADTNADDSALADEFVEAYDDALQRRGVAWNLTTGMYWARPWAFPTLEAQSREYIRHKLNMDIPTHANRCNGSDYLKLISRLAEAFDQEAFPVHSFPELSLAAWMHRETEGDEEPERDETASDPDGGTEAEPEMPSPPIRPYSLRDIVRDGCFLAEPDLRAFLVRLRMKKNLILQGPPGTGKTWLARRLAYAAIGELDESRVRAVQFHPNMSYEDFVRGWRPTADGKLDLTDGPFLEIVSAALQNPDQPRVLVIEEINRGNPAQIFGEMLTLLEADKRTPNEALELSYRRRHRERVYVPEHLYVIGTMNIADRSLALVDLALRRRFAFVTLEPQLGERWRSWVGSHNGISEADLRDIERRISELNDELSSDPGLGPQFRIGHSYVTPPSSEVIQDAHEWFRQVVDTEIGPLLDEYWFDSSDKARTAKARLIDGL